MKPILNPDHSAVWDFRQMSTLDEWPQFRRPVCAFLLLLAMLSRDNEAVTVLSHGRPVLIILNPEDYAARDDRSPRRGRGRPLKEARAVLATAPVPDPELARDMQAVLDSVGSTPHRSLGTLPDSME